MTESTRSAASAEGAQSDSLDVVARLVFLAQAVLVLGEGPNHQWLVPLRAGDTAGGDSPVMLQPVPTGHAGGYVFQVTDDVHGNAAATIAVP